ncbi:beta barrel domain-containing protein [Psychrobacter aquimaris]|uniref:beta barrel domain-containing protein n=1 Tax=Psychrobacter aquimaris TaxID=292733 RepID=UPI0018DF0623|nr:hypothetical protein [Psychrobacter aquimaris]
MSDLKGMSDFANDLMEERQQSFLKKKPIVGQRMFLTERQRNAPPITRIVTVERVGNRYFLLKEFARRRFYIDSKREADTFNSHLTLYASIDCYEYEEDKLKLTYEIKSAINQISPNPLRLLTMVELGVIANLVLKNNKDDKK